MEWRRTGFPLAAATIVATAAFLAGCSDDSPSGNGGDNLDSDAFNQFDALDFAATVNGDNDDLLNQAEQLAAGDFSGLSRSALRDLSCSGGNTWVYTTHAAPKPGYVFDSTYSMQFWSGGSAVSCGNSPEEAAAGSDRVLFDCDEHIMMPFFEGDPGTTGEVETETHSMLDIQGAALGRGLTYSISGSGSYSEEIMGTVEGNAVHTRLTAHWTVDLTKPAGGCLSGTMSVTMGTYTVVTTWNGTPTYTWEMTQAGSTDVIQSGQGFSACL